jgi:SAM-dependent methyltransferase
MPEWSTVHFWRQRYRDAFPAVRKLPIIPSAESWLISCIEARAAVDPSKAKVLDIGAGDRTLLMKLEPVRPHLTYKSQDIDRVWPHDFYDTEEIADQFDFVVSCEVVEHIPATDKVPFFDELFRLTKPGGWVVVTTPNVHHPIAYWLDFTHLNPVHYYDLAGLLGRSGFEDIQLFRLTRMNLQKKVMAFVFRPLLKLLHVDYAQSILAVARRPAASA